MFQAAVFMRSPDSSESPPLKARETMTMKGVAALTASWATAGEAMDREGVGVPQCPRTPEGHIPTNGRCRLIGGVQAVSHHNKTFFFFFSLVPSLKYEQA